MNNKQKMSVKNILAGIGDVAEKVGDSYIDVNIPGLTKVSINAHELNTLISMLRNKGFHNKDIHKKIILTCARILEAFEEAEEKDKLEREAANDSKELPKPKTNAKNKLKDR